MEQYLIEHCAPTLASLKTANLFNIEKCQIGDINREIDYWNEKLNVKGIYVKVLKEKNDRALVYVYRKQRLMEDWLKPGAKQFMECCGYTVNEIDESIELLSQRICSSDEFPHEIGMFLGYPLGDVLGFIKNKGQNCKCTGCWKVYCNECQAVMLFERFEKCRQMYRKLWNGGKAVMQLAVAA